MPRTMPSLREKKRYVFFLVHSEGRLFYPDMKNAIMNSMLTWMGEQGLAKANIWVVKNLWDGKVGAIKCSHTHVDHVKTALALIHQIGDQKVVFETIRVSGTIKSGKKKINTGPNNQ
ncbi:MAG: ribonuclease P protein component 2 [Candidatus Aenigmarchaeota archaeon]|nr:ribonuclease P protein component 2 [Candidatus Aenigmarchaeota archaeon]